MKKYLVLFISVIILSLSLCIPSFASNKRVITLSDDYKYMYYNGATYVRADASMLRFTDRDLLEFKESENVTDSIVESSEGVYTYTAYDNYQDYYKIMLTEEQNKAIKMVEVTNSSHDEVIFFIIIYFCDGSELHLDFILEDLIEDYNMVISGNTKEYQIDFIWPDDNSITVDKDKFYIGNKTTIDCWDYEYNYSIYASSPTDSFDAEIGMILKIENSYYFYSFIESDIKSSLDFYNMNSDKKIKVIELADEELINKIKIGEEKRLNDEFGYLYNDELTETVSKIFFIIVFAIAPAVVCIVTFILALKSKKALYKKLLFATSGISVAEIITFIYIAFTLFNN